MINEKLNKAIRAYMIYIVSELGTISSNELVENSKHRFLAASPKRIAGNLSTLCCYFKDLNYDKGMVSV